MAAATLASSSEGQSIVRVFKFTALADTNTFAYGGPAKAWWVATTSSSSAAVQASYSSGTFTFKVSSGTPDAALFILL